VARRLWFRAVSAPSAAALTVLILLLAAGGYLLTSRTIHHDRDAAAARRVQVEAVHTQEVLGRARAYVEGLAEVLAGEHARTQARFARLAGATSASVGLDDVLWVQRVPGSERGRYERLLGGPIMRLTPSGRFRREPAAGVYLPATFTSRTRPELRPGVDVTGFRGLGAAIRDRARIFAVSASSPGSLGPESGFYLLQAAGFGRGPNSSGYLAAFVPRGWFTTTLGGDPRRVAINEGGRRIDGDLHSVDATASFETLGRRWRIDVAREPPSGLQSTLPWLALAWPFAAALIAFLVGRAVMLRRRLEMDVAERSAELERSEAYLSEAQRLTRTGSVAFAVPTWEVTHSSAEHSRLYGFDPERGIPSVSDFTERIHPEDRSIPSEALERGVREATAVEAEYRVVLPDSEERRLLATAHPVLDASGEIDEFVATVMDVTQRRRAESELERLAGEQAALRRVATLVAREAPQTEVFTAIAEEIGRLLGTEETRMLRYDGDQGALVVARWGAYERVFPLGSRIGLDDDSATARVFRTGKPARIDYATASGPVAQQVRAAAVHGVAAPILVEGRLWGSMITATDQEEPLPPETELRLAQFTGLMATAIANTESRAKAERLTEEQAALRRVATLVAQEAAPAAVFAKVTEELANVLGDVDCSLFRYEVDGTATVLAVCGAVLSARIRVGTRWPVDGTGVIASVLREGRPCRIGDYSAVTGTIAEIGREQLGIRSAVGCPVLVRGRIWGALGAARYEPEALPPETESRIAQFAELVATAIANAEARGEVARLAEEQAALRRVATLVAQGASPSAVFDAVAAEMKGVLRADGVTLGRYGSDDEITVLAHRGSDSQTLPTGTLVSHRGENVTSSVRRTQRAARMEHGDRTRSPIARLARDAGVRASVGAPIVVDGRLWGVAIANWKGADSPPPDTEERMAHFAELLDTAIANADSLDRLTASRARLVTEGDEARRRVVRDLHDGAQQRLVHTVVTLKLAQRALRDDDGDAESLVGQALDHAQQGNVELRELAHGILPAVLTRGGLRAGVGALVSRLDLPVEVDVPAERFPAEMEASAYFIVAEALTNVVKHAHAERAEVKASVNDGVLRVEVRDDGIGGADPGGHGLVGIGDRANALGGRLEIESPTGGGTLLAAALPLAAS
jgi:signal transduction histidine kinase/PAS domain-containing protein